MGVIAMQQPRVARIVGPLLLYLTLVACSGPEPPPANQGISPSPTPDPWAAAAEIKDQTALPTPDPPVTAAAIKDQPTPEPPQSTPLLRAALAEAIRTSVHAYNSVRVFPTESEFDYTDAMAAAQAAYDLAPELVIEAYKWSELAVGATEVFSSIYRDYKNHPGYSVDEARRRAKDPYDGHEVNRIADQLLQDHNRQHDLLIEAGDNRREAYKETAEAWQQLIDHARKPRDPNVVYHDQAAAAAEKAAGMNPGAFGRIGEVHAYFMRCTSRINPLTGIGEQKRCYDYGVAMLTYFQLNPISDIEDKYENMNRSVVNRLEAIGWKSGGKLVFEAVR